MAVGRAGEVVRIGGRRRPGFPAGVCAIAGCCLSCWAIPVDKLIFRRGRNGLLASFESGDVRGCHGEPAVVGHIVSPFGVAVVAVGGAEGANVVRFAVVVPG